MQREPADPPQSISGFRVTTMFHKVAADGERPTLTVTTSQPYRMSLSVLGHAHASGLPKGVWWTTPGALRSLAGSPDPIPHRLGREDAGRRTYRRRRERP